MAPVSVGGATKIALVGSQDGRVYLIDANDGSSEWASPLLGDMVQASPAAMFSAFGGAVDRVFAGTRNGGSDNAFYGLDLATGTVDWSFDNGGGASGIGIIAGGATVSYADDRIYFASRERAGGSSDTVWCLDVNGNLVWSAAVGDVDGSPILVGDRLYVGTNAGEVVALDAGDGSLLWTFSGATGDGPVKGYVWPRSGTGELLFSTTSTVWSIADDGASASLQWSTGAVPSPSIPLVTFAGPLGLWVGGGDGALYELDLDTGAVVSSVTLGDGGAAVGSPVFDVTNDVAYVGSESGAVYAVQLPLP